MYSYYSFALVERHYRRAVRVAANKIGVRFAKISPSRHLGSDVDQSDAAHSIDHLCGHHACPTALRN